jgi:citrate/tricarballylate utilization protein
VGAGGSQAAVAGNFYAVFPHNLLVSLFAPVFLFVVLALGMGVGRFWRAVSPGDAATAQPVPNGMSAALREAASSALMLPYLGGGHGEGCANDSDAPTLWRRRFHHATFYGFGLCFAATSVATLYHYVWGWQAPYAYTSLPVLLGTLGGVGLLVGPLGLLWLNLQRPSAHGEPAQKPMDIAFISLLLLTSATGLALLAWRAGPAMPALLAVHLGVVMALFLTLPYGKFAHGVYRCAALLKYAVEKRQPTRLRLSDG